MKRYAVLSMLAGVLGVVPSVHAHHGPGQFNGGDVTVTGVITKIRLVNPHAYVYFDAKDENGETEAWRCEMQAGSLLKRAGWTADMFPVGGEITVNGAAGTKEKTACLFVTGILPDGSELGRSTQRREVVDDHIKTESKLVDGKLDLNGSWAAPQRYVEAETGGGERAGGGRGGAPGGAPGGGRRGPRGGLPDGIALTEAGKAAEARFQAAGGINPRQECKATNIFFDWTFDRHVNGITQTDDTIVMKYGLMDIERTIHLNMDKHPANIVPSQAGHSIGRLEGATLYVDTIGFMNDGYLSGGLMHSDQLHATETFTYKAEDNSLTRKYSAVDPKNFTGTYSGEDVVFVSNTPYEDYDCVDLKDD
jgi:hypothetical protein